MTYKILCTDGFSKAGLDALKKNSNFEVVFEKALTHEELLSKIGGYHGLIVRSASKVSRDIIEAGANLKIIARAGVGVDNIDVPFAKERGIVVINAPAGNSVSTAELAFALLLSLARHIPQAASAMSQGVWEKKKFAGTQVANKTLGIVGLGRVGREMAKRAKVFLMDVIAYDPCVSGDQFRDSGVAKTSLEELITKSDYISIHALLCCDTENLIGARELKMMKKTACIINCARGGIVNEEDLAAALKEGTIAGAALDVFTKEPFDKPIFCDIPNAICTPHLGASTAEAQDAVAVEAASCIADFFKSGTCPNIVKASAKK